MMATNAPNDPEMESEPVTVVMLEPDDWRDLWRIRLEALRSEPQAFSSTYEETLTWPEERWRQRLANPLAVHLAARTPAGPVGTAGAYFGDDDGDERVAVVFGMYVNAAYRRQGIARALLRSLIELVSTRPVITTIRLWVGETQHPARRLYESIGFRVVGTSDEPTGVELIMERRVR